LGTVIPPPKHSVDVFLLLTSGDQLLLALRQGTGYADGEWNLPSGKLELGEDVVSAMRREAAEELGIQLAADDLTLAATVHYGGRGGRGRVGLVFAAEWNPLRHGEPVNAEPHKCGGIAWYAVDQLPATTNHYSTVCVSAWRSGERLSLDGWTAAT
jgi:8-oxo-dGTP pyrophosphatase MutT (NUDIX family)